MTGGRTTRRALLGGVGALGLAAVGGGAVLRARAEDSGPADLPLRSVTVALSAPGTPVEVPVADAARVVPGTRVLRGARDERSLVAAQRASLVAAPAWVRAGDRWGALARDALLDLQVLALPDGAHVAGWTPAWRYVWPRDSSHVAAAYVATGRAAQAAPLVRFLVRVQSDDGWFEARYRPDGSGPPDDRQRQLDGTGWALWAAATVSTALPRAEGAALAGECRRMARRGLALVDGSTDGGRSLPPASPDYWEVPERSVTLGTVAPLVLGMRCAATVLAGLGDDRSAARARAVGAALASTLEASYGPQGYPRHLDDDDPDAAVGFLAPPYAAAPVARVTAALPASEARMRRRAGGVAPGASWRDDGISWTPETALLALGYAGSGRTADAWRLLDWVERHRTAVGSLPEKVLWDGRPASVAPLGWTAALVLLTLERLRG
ncbi:glycoside hydrolase family 15 [Lapillicoccus jejuensis]|uniref:GH15 family glucan-1,4-alpha-glucosidase n=1 Tax=Lapillicoccus jejuensis TaxID=402171 RepID=A0A542DXA5_9MICO|nr:glycoside hydrolase family 15 [Lapillicoccus jejuensis]TQJ07705.1 hypothetical protein FB458_0773 [Lapillicoccus jejuensis]